MPNKIVRKCSSIASTGKGYFFDSLPSGGLYMDKCSVINTSVPLIHFWDTSYALVNGLCRIGCTGEVISGGTSGNNSITYDDTGGT